MRLKFILVVGLLMTVLGVHAQDQFANISRSRTKVLPDRVIVGETSTKFRMTVDGKENNFSIRNSDMFEFVYDSLSPLGRIEAINLADTTALFRIGAVYVRGKYDAIRNYDMYTSSGVSTFFATTLLTPVVGACVAVPTSLATPKIQNLGHPDEVLIEDRIYYQGYSEQARKIKSRRVWLNFGIGFGINLGIIYWLFIATDFGTPKKK